MSWRNLSPGIASRKGLKMDWADNMLDSLKGIAETEAIGASTETLRVSAVRHSIAGLASLFVVMTGKTPAIGVREREVKAWFRKLSLVNAVIQAFLVALAAIELKRRSDADA